MQYRRTMVQALMEVQRERNSDQAKVYLFVSGEE
ncbi:unnamed protein product [Brassica napus]|uniref:(rape) hypothetical protein n=1 Tax=Brassica napus TaxID=3708 RepID=A0A816MLD7_BRANA|nr:unnamed protein product [Brassica napus]